jgi:hypothetical protein
MLASIYFEKAWVGFSLKPQVDIHQRITKTLGRDHPDTLKHMVDTARTFSCVDKY